MRVKIMQRVVTLLGAFMIVSLTTGAHARQGDDRRPVVVGYFADWTGADASTLPGELLTHVMYAFAVIKDGRIALPEAPSATELTPRQLEVFSQLERLKAAHPHVKVLVSVGGWGASDPFFEMARNEHSRAAFAKSCSEFVSHHKFDGIDIDWEYPGGGGKNPEAGNPRDTRNFTLLLKQLRAALDEQGRIDAKRYLLTIAAPAGEQHYKKIELDRVHESLDLINLMTYDYAGAWSKLTCFNAPLHAPLIDGKPAQSDVDGAVRAYLSAGVPAEKLVLGVPFYGRAFGGVPDENAGLHQPHDRSSPEAPGSGQWTWKNISQHSIAHGPARHWHERAMVPWLYDPATKVMLTYDDPQSLHAKGKYARSNKLAGVMIWELSQDDAQWSLLKSLHAGLKE